MEIWLDSKENPEFYEVSNCGNVRNKKTGKILKNNKKKTGYLSVTFAHGNKKDYSVHRLVAEVFLPNKDNLPCVNHKDEDKTNNNVDNLEWCTQKYNVNYGIGALARNQKVIQKDACGNAIKTWESMKEIEQKTGIKYQNISRCCRKERITCHGYIWEYA